MNFYKFLSIYLKSFRNKKFFYSFGGIDNLIQQIFKSQKKGIYIDIGCGHPIKNNNTYLLNKKGWSGINIDLDFHTIDLFNHIRRRDENICAAISEEEGERELYFFHNRSAINSLDKGRKDSANEIKKIKTFTLNSIIEKTKFRDKKINLLLIDVEGHELEVIKSINLKKYSPEMIIIEFLDNDLSKLEFTNQSINSVLDSAIYKYMINNNYHFVNWLHSDLVFVHTSVRS